MKDFSIEELKTAIGHLMCDLRGNWAYEYTSRMNEVCLLLNQLITKDPDNELLYMRDLQVTKSEMDDPYDGRVFRDQCMLFGYGSDLGKTQKVRNYLATVLTHPEHNQI